MMEHAPTVHTTEKVTPRTDQWWRGAVIYQIYPRSFADGNGDGIGDLVGIAEHLDHIASLNVDAVWISPFFKSPMKDFGYDVADYCDVDPIFGTLADFDRVLARTHELGMKLMIDFVPSHTSNRHPWFLESRESREGAKADWYVWVEANDDGMPPNNWLSVFGGLAWAWEPRRGQYYLHNFLVEQPDLNFHNPEVIDALCGEAAFWLDKGVDGFRIDAIDFGVHDLELRDNPPRPRGGHFTGGVSSRSPFAMQYQQYNKARPELSELFFKPVYRLSERYESRTLLGEISGDYALERMGEYSDGGGLDMAYSFDLLTCPWEPEAIRSIIERTETKLGGGWPCWAFSNHDVIRSATRLGGDHKSEDRLALIPMVLCSLRGTVCLYQGEELGIEEAELAYEQLQDPVGLTFWPDNKGRDGCRTPMPWSQRQPHGGFSPAEPWLPMPAKHLERAVDHQANDPKSVLSQTKAFLAWRKDQAPLVSGDIVFVDCPETLLAFERRQSNDHMLCVFNFSDQEQQMQAPAGLANLDCPTATANLAQGQITLPPNAAFFGRLA